MRPKNWSLYPSGLNRSYQSLILFKTLLNSTKAQFYALTWVPENSRDYKKVPDKSHRILILLTGSIIVQSAQNFLLASFLLSLSSNYNSETVFTASIKFIWTTVIFLFSKNCVSKTPERWNRFFWWINFELHFFFELLDGEKDVFGVFFGGMDFL